MRKKYLFTIILIILSMYSNTVLAYPSRFTIEEAQRDGGGLLDTIITLITLYPIGFSMNFIGCILKFRHYFLKTNFLKACFNASIKLNKSFMDTIIGMIFMLMPLLFIVLMILFSIINYIFKIFSTIPIYEMIFYYYIVFLIFTIIFSVHQSLSKFNDNDFKEYITNK